MRKQIVSRGPWLLADWLGLAAAPAFAIMALLTRLLDSGPRDMLCAAAHDASPLAGMVPMYVLMSVFHLAPWLKLISNRRSRRRIQGPGFAQKYFCAKVLAAGEK
jgi:hypothetical protein